VVRLFTPLTSDSLWGSLLPPSLLLREAPLRRSASAAGTPPCLRSTRPRPPTRPLVKAHQHQRADCRLLILPLPTTVPSTPNIPNWEYTRALSWTGRRLWYPVTRWEQVVSASTSWQTFYIRMKCDLQWIHGVSHETLLLQVEVLSGEHGLLYLETRCCVHVWECRSHSKWGAAAEWGFVLENK